MLAVVDQPHDLRREATLFGIAIVLAGAFITQTLTQVGWDPTLYTAFGEQATSTRSYAEDRLGKVFLRPGQGHDGKFFFVQANDPWVLEPEENAAALDRPLYRSQRMLYPFLAGGGGLLGPEAISWALIVVNVLALGAGTVATARVAVLMGMSSWWGLAFLLNLGFISELIIDGAGILAASLAFWSLALLLKGRTGGAVILMALSALTREAMLLAAAGTAFWLWRQLGRRRDAFLMLALPLGSAALWAIYLRLRIGFESGTGQVQEIGWPFLGFVEAIEAWRSDPLDAVVGVAIMLMLLLFVRRALQSRHLLSWAFVGVAALGSLFTEQVWRSFFDITRAVAPVLTAFALLVFAPVRTADGGSRPAPHHRRASVGR